MIKRRSTLYNEEPCNLWFYSATIRWEWNVRGMGQPWRCATSRKDPGSITGRVTGDFFRSIRQAHELGVDLASKNEYQDISGGKGDRWRPYHLHVASVYKSGSLNLLDPSRPRRPVTGILYLLWGSPENSHEIMAKTWKCNTSDLYVDGIILKWSL